MWSCCACFLSLGEKRDDEPEDPTIWIKVSCLLSLERPMAHRVCDDVVSRQPASPRTGGKGSKGLSGDVELEELEAELTLDAIVGITVSAWRSVGGWFGGGGDRKQAGSNTGPRYMKSEIGSAHSLLYTHGYTHTSHKTQPHYPHTHNPPLEKHTICI